VTITLTPEVALWARRKAAEENTSVSRLVGQMLEREMRMSDSYRAAFERFQAFDGVGSRSASERMSREECHERR